MEHKITTKKIIQASKTCKKAKRTLEILFPEAFESEKPFCKINDVLIRKRTNGFYQVKEKENKVVLVNITADHVWENKIDLPYNKFCGDTNKILSRQDFKDLALGQIKSVDDFKVLDLDDVHHYSFNY